MSIGQLLWKAKWETPLADWIVAIGLEFIGLGNRMMRSNELRGLLDVDVSHSCERRLDTCTKGIG
jgi:hypothetical protein